ncbi:hypothetical protein [Pseudomonas faucium]|uniref:hypothetical protein n=1 Tax=Pseudomonas faucium TaxID=2740518 RepID=UPI001F1B2448|nr:hypothetical protein [Pseudomonas faucium]
MSEQVLAAIGSLQTQVTCLHGEVAALHGEVSGKADASAVTSLSGRITACEGVVSSLGSPITAQGQAISTLTSRVTGMSNSAVSMDQSGYLTGDKQALQAAEDARCRAESNKCAATATESLDGRYIRSGNYVPGVSGIRLDLKTGSFEVNGGSLAIGGLPSEPQKITVTAGEWAESEMPANAVERYRFIGNKLIEIPCQYRDSAEFSTEDISFDRDGSDVRTRLTYQRMETAEEAKARASRPASSVVVGERGGLTITYGGKVVARLGCWKDDDQPA